MFLINTRKLSKGMSLNIKQEQGNSFQSCLLCAYYSGEPLSSEEFVGVEPALEAVVLVANLRGVVVRKAACVAAAKAALALSAFAGILSGDSDKSSSNAFEEEPFLPDNLAEFFGVSAAFTTVVDFLVGVEDLVFGVAPFALDVLTVSESLAFGTFLLSCTDFDF